MASELFFRGQDAHHVIDAYTPKPHKPWLTVIRRPLRYMLKENRLVFLFAGIAIASLIFALLPSSPTAYTNYDDIYSDSHSTINAHHPIIYQNRAVAGKIPLGLKNKRLRILVTGGAGFVGSHLVDRLIARGDSVIVADNFFTGRKENVMHHFGNPRFELIRHDVVEPLLVEVDQIYHLACPASPVHYKHNPLKTIKTNVLGTLNMLGLAKRVGARFLFRAPARFTVIRWNIHKRRLTGAMLIPLVSLLSLMTYFGMVIG